LSRLNRSLRRNLFPLQRPQKRRGFLETDAEIASCRGIAAATDDETSMCTGLRTSIGKLIEMVSIDSGRLAMI
jgi:hypothetical protein